MLQKIYIIAGEASADLHGSRLMKSFNEVSSELEWRGWGGSKMIENGLHADIRYEDASFMGFVEVLKNITYILKLFSITKSSILEFKPDALILIDYPGFNLRMAKWAKTKGIPVYYYIAPQVWAWKEKRVKILQQNVQKLFVILPFELKYFTGHKVKTYYFGHPLSNLIQSFHPSPTFRSLNHLTNKSIIALLPGSRVQEIKTMLPIFLKAVSKECKYQIVLAGLTHHAQLYKELITKSGNCSVAVIYNSTYDILANSRIALVTSGTATLETALFKVPQIVCYKGNRISYWIARKLIKVPYISLVNLILKRKVVTELIQDSFNVEQLKFELSRLKEHDIRSNILQDYRELISGLLSDNPSQRIVQEIISDFN